MACLCAPLHGQTWTGGPTGPIYYNGGNVGIGTPNPAYPLTVNGTVGSTGGTALIGATDRSTGTFYGLYGSGGIMSLWRSDYPVNLMSFTNAGNVGIGTTSPQYQLTVYNPSASSHISSQIAQPTNYASIDWINDNRRISIGVGGSSVGDGVANKMYWWDAANSVYRMVLDSATGNVGIGTTNPTSKLSVNGTIQAKEVVVNTGWSDYVFHPSYRLKPLSEVAAYIQQNHHLPDIPSEAEVRDNGVSLGDIQSKLLAKIEELTLHMIRAEERNDRLEQTLHELQKQNQELRERIEQNQ